MKEGDRSRAGPISNGRALQTLTIAIYACFLGVFLSPFRVTAPEMFLQAFDVFHSGALLSLSCLWLALHRARAQQQYVYRVLIVNMYCVISVLTATVGATFIAATFNLQWHVIEMPRNVLGLVGVAASTAIYVYVEAIQSKSTGEARSGILRFMYLSNLLLGFNIVVASTASLVEFVRGGRLKDITVFDALEPLYLMVIGVFSASYVWKILRLDYDERVGHREFAARELVVAFVWGVTIVSLALAVSLSLFDWYVLAPITIALFVLCCMLLSLWDAKIAHVVAGCLACWMPVTLWFLSRHYIDGKIYNLIRNTITFSPAAARIWAGVVAILGAAAAIVVKAVVEAHVKRRADLHMATAADLERLPNVSAATAHQIIVIRDSETIHAIEGATTLDHRVVQLLRDRYKLETPGA